MTDGTSIGLFTVLAIVIFGLLFIIMVTVVLPNTENGMTIFRNGAESIVNKRETVAPRTLG